MKAPTLTHLFLAEFVRMIFTCGAYFLLIKTENIIYGFLIISVMNVSVTSFLGISTVYYLLRSKIESPKNLWIFIVLLSLLVNMFFYWLILDYNLILELVKVGFTNTEVDVILFGCLSGPIVLSLMYLKIHLDNKKKLLNAIK